MTEESPSPPPPAPPSSGAYHNARPTDSGAIAALIVGLISPIGALMFYGVTGIILGAVAVYLGLAAGGRIKRAGGLVGGAGMAQAGWIIGLCAIVLGVVLMVATIGYFLFTGPGPGKKGV